MSIRYTIRHQGRAWVLNFNGSIYTSIHKAQVRLVARDLIKKLVRK